MTIMGGIGVIIVIMMVTMKIMAIPGGIMMTRMMAIIIKDILTIMGGCS